MQYRKLQRGGRKRLDRWDNALGGARGWENRFRPLDREGRGQKTQFFLPANYSRVRRAAGNFYSKCTALSLRATQTLTVSCIQLVEKIEVRRPATTAKSHQERPRAREEDVREDCKHIDQRMAEAKS